MVNTIEPDGVRLPVPTSVLNVLNRCRYIAVDENYLGLAVYIGRLKKKMFEYIKQKIWIRIQG